MGIHGNTYRMTMSDVRFQKRCRIASATSSLALLQRSAAAARARQREFSRASALQKCAKHKTETNTKHTKRWPKCCKMVQNGAKWYNMVQNACASGSGHEGRFNVYGYIGHFYALHCIAMIAYVCVGLQSNHGLRHSSCAFSLSLGSTHIRWQVSKRCECTSAHTSRNDGQCVYSHPSYFPILLFWAVPLPNTLLWHIRTEDFIEEISWLNLSNRSSLKFRPSGLGFLQFLSRFAKAWCCTMLHYLAPLSMVELPLCVCKSVLLVFLLQNVLQRCQGLWTPLGKNFGLQLYCKWFLLKVFCVFNSRQHRRKLQS